MGMLGGALLSEEAAWAGGKLDGVYSLCSGDFSQSPFADTLFWKTRLQISKDMSFGVL